MAVYLGSERADGCSAPWRWTRPPERDPPRGRPPLGEAKTPQHAMQHTSGAVPRLAAARSLRLRCGAGAAATPPPASSSSAQRAQALFPILIDICTRKSGRSTGASSEFTTEPKRQRTTGGSVRATPVCQAPARRCARRRLGRNSGCRWTLTVSCNNPAACFRALGAQPLTCTPVCCSVVVVVVGSVAFATPAHSTHVHTQLRTPADTRYWLRSPPRRASPSSRAASPRSRHRAESPRTQRLSQLAVDPDRKPFQTATHLPSETTSGSMATTPKDAPMPLPPIALQAYVPLPFGFVALRFVQ